MVLLVTAGLTSCNSEQKQASAPPETVSGVALMPVARTAVPDVVESVGTVHAGESAQIAAQMMGSIVAVNVHEGDHVRRGQVLAVIDDSQPRAAGACASRRDCGGKRSRRRRIGVQSGATTLKRYAELYRRSPSVRRNSTRSRPADKAQAHAAIWPVPDKHRPRPPCRRLGLPLNTRDSRAVRRRSN